MQVKRFVAADMRRALELVRQDMGPDAIILSSGRTEGGVEVLTSYDSPFQSGDANSVVKKNKREIGSAMSSLNQQLLSKFKRSESGEEQSKPLPSDAAWARENSLNIDLAKPADRSKKYLESAVVEKRFNESELDKSVEAERLKNISQQQEFRLASFNYEPGNVNVSLNFDPSQFVQVKTNDSQISRPESTDSATRKKDIIAAKSKRQAKEDRQLNALREEILDMRELLQLQLSQLGQSNAGNGTKINATNNLNTLSVSNTVHTTIAKRLENMGIPQDDIVKCTSRLKLRSSLADGWAQVLATLAHRLPTTSNDVVDGGGFFSFVGSAGAGKTTTVAKLAARYVLKHGAEGVALISTDNQSMAGVEQLRRVGKILGVEVHHVNETNTLSQVMLDCCDYKLVLIDTAGLRQGDAELKQQLAKLRGFSHLKNYLVMASNAQTQVLKASVHAYKNVGLSGCILTKLDETISLGETLGVVMHEKIPVSYYTDGRDFTRHIGVARSHNLITFAVSLFKKANQDSGENKHGPTSNKPAKRDNTGPQRFAYN